MTSQRLKNLSYEELEQYCSDLERKLVVSEENNKRLTALLGDVTSDRNWMKGLLGNMSIPMREKVVLYGAWCVIRKKKKEVRPDGLTHVYRSDISKFTGLSENQVGDGLKNLKDHGIIDRKIEPHYNSETGRHEKHNLMALGDLALENPRAIDFSTENNWGGKRENSKKKKVTVLVPNACEHCGSEDFIVHAKIICTECGTQVDEKWKPVESHDHSEEDNSEAEN